MKKIIEDFKIFGIAIKINYKICKSLIWCISIHSLLNAFFPIATAYFSSAIINSLISKDAYRKTVLMVLIFLLIQLIWRLVLYIISKQIQMKKSIWNNMCANYINRISSKMDYEHFENPRVNEIYTRVCSANDNREGLYAINGLFGQFISNITKVCSCFALFASIIVGTSVGTEKGWLYFVNSSYMTILFIVILIVKAVLQCKTDSKMTKKVYDVWGETARENMFFGRLFSLGTDFRNGMTLRIFNEDKLILKNTRDFVKNPNKISKITNLWIKSSVIHNIFDLLFIAFQYFFIVGRALSGAMGIGNFVFYSQTITSFSDGVMGLANLSVDLSSNNRFIKDFLEYTNLPNKMRSGTKAVPNLKYSDCIVEFVNVSFKYPNSEKYVLKNINISLPMDRITNIVGVNGSGKTTFIKLLCRLYDPTEGVIKLNGIDIREFDYDSYMRFFSIVFQDFKLFSFTLGQNVALSNSYDDSIVEKSLAEAGFESRLESLKDGLGTYLYKTFENDGVEISGGEAQKIAIARSLYKDAKIMIMDEPTAALDPIAEFDIFNRIQQIIQNRTVICISHRLSSCRICDRILVFLDGEIAQDGSHKELVNVEGPYKELWNAQAQYYMNLKGTQ